MPYLLLLIKYDFFSTQFGFIFKRNYITNFACKGLRKRDWRAFSPFAKHSLISIFIYRLHSTHYTTPHTTHHTPHTTHLNNLYNHFDYMICYIFLNSYNKKKNYYYRSSNVYFLLVLQKYYWILHHYFQLCIYEIYKLIYYTFYFHLHS